MLTKIGEFSKNKAQLFASLLMNGVMTAYSAGKEGVDDWLALLARVIFGIFVALAIIGSLWAIIATGEGSATDQIDSGFKEVFDPDAWDAPSD